MGFEAIIVGEHSIVESFVTVFGHALMQIVLLKLD